MATKNKKPVEKKPRYKSEMVESSLGDKFQGCSTKKQIGNSNKDPQIKIDAVKFSFLLLLNFFKVSNPPIT